VIEEGRLLARVRHPNVVTVYGAECLNFQVGIWTEFIEGETLHAIVTERGPLPPEDVVSIGLDLCGALASVHAAGLLHRDIKAQNVMREHGGRIVLMDFGTGRDVEPQSDRPHDVSGTPIYLAPELFAAGEASVASDVYALAVLLFFLLTARYPVSGRTLEDVRAAHHELRAAHRHELSPDVPAHLRQAIEQGLATDPSQRHETAQAFRAALARVVVNRVEGPAQDPPRSPWFRHALAAAAIMGAAILGGVAWIAMDSGYPAPTASDGSRIRDEQVWTGPNVNTNGTVSPDGRYLSAADPASNLVLHDLITGEDRPLITGSDVRYPSESAIARDGAKIAYAWQDLEKRRSELRVLTFDAAGVSAPRTLVDDADIRWLVPWDWSPDGKWIAVSLERVDRTTHLCLVSTADGSRAELKPVDWRGPTRMVFSPDGRSIAYDLAVADAVERDVFVMDIDERREIPAVVNPSNDVIAGWTPDGTALLFTSDRSGSNGVWAVPVANGAPAGAARLIKPDLGSRAFSIGVTSSGTLVYSRRPSSLNVYVAEVDFETGKVVTPPAEASDAYLLTNEGAEWSTDGSRLAFLSDRPNNVQALSIVSVGGTEPRREWRPGLDWFNRPRWAPDGSITVQGADLTGRPGIHRIDMPSGRVSPIVTCGQGVSCIQASWSLNGKQLAYRRITRLEAAVVIRDVNSGLDRELLKTGKGIALHSVALAPDGTQVSYVQHDKKVATLYVHPVSGGPPRVLLRRLWPDTLENVAEWTPDGRHLIVGASTEGRVATMTLWSVPVNGGSPVKIEGLKPRYGGNTLRIHSDGRRVAFSMGQRSQEVWLLKNFLTSAGATK
jgi:Tol biopolymer transport system component